MIMMDKYEYLKYLISTFAEKPLKVRDTSLEGEQTETMTNFKVNNLISHHWFGLVPFSFKVYKHKKEVYLPKKTEEYTDLRLSHNQQSSLPHDQDIQ